jgi:hypothetical protein
MKYTRFLIVALPLVLIISGVFSVGIARAVPTLAWSDQHDGGADYLDDGYRLLIDPAGNLVVGGESSDPTEGIDMYIRKLDRVDGHEMWSRRVEGYDNKDMALSEMTWDSVGQLLVAGYIRGCVG